MCFILYICLGTIFVDCIHMKKIFAILTAIMLLASCEAKREYETTITYRIYYPSNTITKTVTKRTTENPSYLLASDRGSNYLVFNTSNHLFDKYCEKLEDTSAPIEVVSFVKVKK